MEGELLYLHIVLAQRVQITVTTVSYRTKTCARGMSSHKKENVYAERNYLLGPEMKKKIKNKKIMTEWCLTLIYPTQFKDARSCFSKFSFLVHLKKHLFKDVNSKFQLKWSNCGCTKQFCILQLPIFYCVKHYYGYRYHNQTCFH